MKALKKTYYRISFRSEGFWGPIIAFFATTSLQRNDHFADFFSFFFKPRPLAEILLHIYLWSVAIMIMEAIFGYSYSFQLRWFAS